MTTSRHKQDSLRPISAGCRVAGREFDVAIAEWVRCAAELRIWNLSGFVVRCVARGQRSSRRHGGVPLRLGVLISESQCRVVVAKIRDEIAADAGTPVKVFVPQTRLPGAEGEVDWGKFDAVIGGETVTLHLFSMWLAFSTNAFHRAYVNEAQESFTDAHVRARRARSQNC